MRYHRVLVVHSFADALMKGRIKRILRNPSLESLAFDHFAIIDKSRGSAHVAELDRLADIGHDPQAR
jgi:hypothetical protein